MTATGVTVAGNRLARALLRLGLRAGDVLAVVCCDHHDGDGELAVAAARGAGATPVVFDLTTTDWGLRAAAHVLGPRVAVACADGVERWRRAGCRGILVADAPNAYWSKALAVRESGAPLDTESVPAVVASFVGSGIGGEVRVPQAVAEVDNGSFLARVRRTDGSEVVAMALVGEGQSGRRVALRCDVIDQDVVIVDLLERISAATPPLVRSS